MPFVSPIYSVPLGAEIGRVPVSRFTGSPTSGLLANVSHSVFFSPSFNNSISGNQIDIDTIEVTVVATDVYSAPIVENNRVFTWGPHSNSRTNTSVFVTMPKAYTVIATMIQTIPPGPTQIFKIL